MSVDIPPWEPHLDKEYNEDQKKALALYPEWSPDHMLLSAYFRNPDDFSLTDAGQAIAAQKFGPHATHIRFSYIFQNAWAEIVPILAITAIANGQSPEERKKIFGVLSIKEYVQKKGTPVLPLARRVRQNVRIWLASSVPKKPRIWPLGPGEKIYQWVVTNLPIWQILSIDNTRQKKLLFAYFTNPGAFVFTRMAFLLIRNLLQNQQWLALSPPNTRFTKFIIIDGFVYDEVKGQIYLHVQARGRHDTEFQDYRIPVSQIEDVLHRLIELTTIKT